MTDSAILVEVRRGDVVESRHSGHVVVVDGDGETIAALGAPETVTFLRSSAKPFQTVAFLLSGAAERYGFSDAEIALACGSHNGESIHTNTARLMLEKIGLDEDALHCGAHEPFNQDLARQMIRNNERPSALHNNCSGKHAAMIAFAASTGAPLGTYETLKNPIQQKILETVAQFAGIDRDRIKIGIDGCSVPNFALPIQIMAAMYARLVLPPADFNRDLREACRRTVVAMLQHPEMIGGSVTERLDTKIIQAGKGKIISKVGAEGLYTAGVLPSPEWKRGLGIAFKVEDGEDRRARPVAALEILRQLGIFDAGKLETLAPYAKQTIKNHRGDAVGEVVPMFDLGLNRATQD